jgi:hypothetical protein
MFNPAVHGINIFSDVMAETSLNPITAIKTIQKGNELWKAQSVVVDDFVKAGGNLEGLYEFNKNLRDGITGELSKHSENPLLEAYRMFTNFNDKVLWDKIVKGAQLGIFQMRRDALMKEHGAKFGKELIDKMAAQKTNNLLGTLPHIWLDRFTREAGSIAFFARNWTLSNVNLVANALGKGWGLKGMPLEANRVMQKEYIEHLAKGVFGLTAYANLMNYALVGHSTFDNEKGHRMDIDTGMKRPDGRHIYITPHFYRYIRDYFSWATDPSGTLINKLEPILKNSGEQILDYSLHMKNSIVPKGATTDKNLMEELYTHLQYRVPYTIRAVTPVGRFNPTEGYHKTFSDIMIELTGTHERHGLSMQATAWDQLPTPRKAEFLTTLRDEEKALLNTGLNIGFIFNDNRFEYKGYKKSVQVATKLKDFLLKHKYETRELDINIMEDLNKGKFDMAISKMKKYQRYMNVRGAKEKVLPYQHMRRYIQGDY